MKNLLLSILLLAGCASSIKPKAIQLHPTLGTSLLIIPKGNDIGHYKAPENGVFMTEEVFKKMVRELLSVKIETKKYY